MSLYIIAIIVNRTVAQNKLNRMHIGVANTSHCSFHAESDRLHLHFDILVGICLAVITIFVVTIVSVVVIVRRRHTRLRGNRDDQ